jgi:phage host-nuclease inhibitor protein Gam
MSKSRIKVKLPTIATRDEAEVVMNELAVSANTLRAVIARRDARVLEIQEMFASDISQHEENIATNTDILHAWAEASPDQFTKGRKSLDLAAGTLGFRTGTPKLSLLSRAWNWAKVLAKLKELGNRIFIRKIEEVDKETIISSRGQVWTDATLAAFGVKVVQEESFFIEPKLTDTDARQAVEVK